MDLLVVHDMAGEDKKKPPKNHLGNPGFLKSGKKTTDNMGIFMIFFMKLDGVCMMGLKF